jgi:hypothetical protein
VGELEKMTESKKPLEIKFAPGAFDQFDGTQEELDQMMAEIMDMFANMSPEELEAASKPVDWDNLSEEEITILEQALNNEPRTLQ